ncbi:thymidine kinase [Mollicutes bacterium LVI A0039]|nr:thymidine kinase [Mollicutes bacterium LVI A0039]
MAKTTIYFTYGSMNSGKSLELIKVAYNYKENDINCLVLKPEIDTRAVGKVTSRTRLEVDAVEIEESNPEQVLKVLEANHANIILVDEANFLSKEVVDCIVDYCYNHKVSSLLFFGLKVDFRGNLFEGSKRIIECADKIEEATSICWCGKKARQNARVVNGKIIKDGPTVLVDDETVTVDYTPLCNYHFRMEQLDESKY